MQVELWENLRSLMNHDYYDNYDDYDDYVTTIWAMGRGGLRKYLKYMMMINIIYYTYDRNQINMWTAHKSWIVRK